MFVYSPSYFGYDGYEGVGFSSIILYDVNKWVVFGMPVCEGLVGEIVVAFNELHYECRTG